MIAKSGNNLFSDNWNKYAAFLSVLLILGIVPFVALLAIGRQSVALVYLAIPVIVFLLTVPRYGFFLLVFINFICAPMMISGFAVHPGDICAFIFIGALVLSWLLSGQPLIDRTPLDYPFLGLILATVISGIFAHRPSLSLPPISRIILIYLTFRAFYTFSGKYGTYRMILSYIYSLTVFSLINGIFFLMMGGVVRIFGISGIAFETLLMAGVPLNIACAIWAETRKKQLFMTLLLAINLLASIATMSRGLLLTILLAGIVLLAFSSVRARKLNLSLPREYIRRFVLVVIPLTALSLAAWSLFTPVLVRFQELLAGEATGTVLLRFTLWKAAFEGFLTSPLTGIGIGNFRVIDSILPHLKFDPLRYYLIGMSFHNIFLQYLCETGLIGLSMLLWLAYRAFSISKDTGIRMVGSSDKAAIMSAFIGAFTIFITIFYMRTWTWGQEGYVFAFILAMVAGNHGHISKQDLSICESHE